MPIRERITSVDRVRQWADAIPLHYEYTAGVAGEKFLRGLMDGKLVGGRCDKCGTTFLPPKTYCVTCFERITSFVDVVPVGRVAAIASSIDSNREADRFVFVQFDAVIGGLVHRVRGETQIGGRVKVRFKPKGRRKGSILDIDCFEPLQ